MQPRIPVKYNELSLKHQLNLQKIVDKNLNKSVTMQDKNSNFLQRPLDKDPVFLSMIDMKPVNPPYLKLIPLKDYSMRQQLTKVTQ